MKRLVLFCALLCPALAIGQGTGVRYDGITLSPSGRPVPANVAVCNSPGLATTAAQVIGNTAILTMSSNPVTAGFAANMQIVVSGFTGGDTFFNVGILQPFSSTVTITAVSSTTITFPLTHVNATASTNGSVFQMGNASTSCAPLASIFSDSALAVPITQPGFTSSNIGNVGFYLNPGSYGIQFYGTGVQTYLQPLTLMMAFTNANNAFTGNNTHSGTETFNCPLTSAGCIAESAASPHSANWRWMFLSNTDANASDTNAALIWMNLGTTAVDTTTGIKIDNFGLSDSITLVPRGPLGPVSNTRTTGLGLIINALNNDGSGGERNSQFAGFGINSGLNSTSSNFGTHINTANVAGMRNPALWARTEGHAVIAQPQSFTAETSCSSGCTVSAGTTATITPTTMTVQTSAPNIVVGLLLLMDTGSAQEYVRVTATTVSTFTAFFQKAHAGAWSIASAQPEFRVTGSGWTATPDDLTTDAFTATKYGYVFGNRFTVPNGNTQQFNVGAYFGRDTLGNDYPMLRPDQNNNTDLDCINNSAGSVRILNQGETTNLFNVNCNTGVTTVGGTPVTLTIASGTATLTANATLTTNTCQTAITVAAAGAATTDSIEWSYATAPAIGDALETISPYLTSGNVNFTRCNTTSASQNVTAIVINWRVLR